MEYLMMGNLRVDGESVTFTYAEMQEFFQRCDSAIDPSRFEEMMQEADAASLFH